MRSDLLLRRPERSAHASIRGYLYQACLGALRWLELENGEVLLCEGDEDLDRYFTSGDRTLEQVKDVSGNLGVTVVRETLRNFLLSWVHLRRQNDGVRFVFTSTAEVGKGSPARAILDGWEEPGRGEGGLSNGILPGMKVLSAKFVDGRLDVPQGTLHEGDTVTLLVREHDENEGFSLTPDETARLKEAMAQADRGEGVDGWELLEELG